MCQNYSCDFKYTFGQLKYILYGNHLKKLVQIYFNSGCSSDSASLYTFASASKLLWAADYVFGGLMS